MPFAKYENKYEYEYEYEYEHEHEKRMNGIRSDMFIRQLYLICRMQMDEKEWKYIWKASVQKIVKQVYQMCRMQMDENEWKYAN